MLHGYVGTLGEVDRLALPAAEVDGDVHAPVGVDVQVVAELLGEVNRALFRIIHPAHEGQALHGGIVGLYDAAVIRRVDVAVDAHVIVVVQAVHLIVAHAVQLDRDVVGRHGERDRAVIGGVGQIRSIGSEPQVVEAVRQRAGEGHLIAGGDGVHVVLRMRGDVPGADAIRSGDGELSGDEFQLQGDLRIRLIALAAGQGQSALDGAAARAHQDRALGAVKRLAGDGQRPAVRLALDGREAQRVDRAVVRGDGELGALGRVGRFDDVGDLAGRAVDGHFHVDVGALVAVQVGGREGHLAGERARLIQQRGRLRPVEVTGHIGLVRRGRLQVQLDAVQRVAVIGGVGHLAREGQSGAGDGDDVGGVGVHDGVHIHVTDADDIAGLKGLQRDGGLAGHDRGLLQHGARDVDGRARDHLAGIHVSGVELALGHVHGATRVRDGVGRVDDDLHADLSVDGEHRRGSAVVGGVLGREQHLIDRLAVVRVHGHDGVVRPGKAALHGLATGGCGAGQCHVRQAGAVGNEAAAGRIGDAGGDGHGVLLHRQGHVLAARGEVAVVVGEGHDDLHGVLRFGVAVHRIGGLIDSDGDLIHVGLEFVVGVQRGHGEIVNHVNAGEVVGVHGVRVRNGRQRRGEDVIGGGVGAPDGLVAAVADGTGGDHQVGGGLGQLRARPAEEGVARAGGIAQRDGVAVHGVRGRDGLRHGALSGVDAEGIGDDLPVRGQGDVTGVARGDADCAVHGVDALRRPAEEAIAPAGGLGDGDGVALDGVGCGIGRGVLAAVQLIADGVRQRLPACVQRRAVRGDELIQPDVALRGGAGRAEPAEELIVLALRILGDVLQGRTHVLQVYVVGHILHAVVQLIGDHGDLAPAGVEGHAAGQHVLRRIHALAGEVRIQIPAGEHVASVARQLVVQRGLTQLMGGVGIAGVLALIAREDQAVVIGLRRALRAAQVHGDVDAPVGVQHHVAGQQLREVEGRAGAGGVVIPAREGQAVHSGIGGRRNGHVLVHVDVLVHAQIVVVIQEAGLIAVHAVERDRHVVGGHGECDRIAVGHIGQALGLGGEAHALVALRQLRDEHHLFAGLDGVQLRRVMGLNLPALDALAGVHGELLGQLAQLQRDDGALFAAIDRQAGGDALVAVHAHHDRTAGAVEGGAGHGQAPAVRGARHAGEGQSIAAVVGANREHGVLGRVVGLDDVGDVAGVALVAVGVQIERQVVLLRGLEHVIADEAPVRQQIAQRAGVRRAVLIEPPDAVERGVEPGQRGARDFGIALLRLRDQRVQIDLAIGAGGRRAAQHVDVLKAGLQQRGVVPVRRLDAPAVGAPVVQREAHVDRGGGHLELAVEREHLAVVLDQLGTAPVLIRQHHVALVVLHLVGGCGVFVRVDRADAMSVRAIAEGHDVDARVAGLGGLAVDDDVLQRQLRRDLALLQRLKQQLAFDRSSRVHVEARDGQIGQVVRRDVVGILGGLRPCLLQLILVDVGHVHASAQAVHRPAAAPERRAHLKGHEQEVDYACQIQVEVDADLEVQSARIIASARRRCRLVHEHARYLGIGICRAGDVGQVDDGEAAVQRQGETEAHAQLADQIDLAGHVAVQGLLIGAALELLEVEVEAHLIAVFRRDRDAEAGDDGRLAHQLHLDAEGDQTVAHALLISEQAHCEPVLILQLVILQLLHDEAQVDDRAQVVVVVDLLTVGGDDLRQALTRLCKQIAFVVAGGRIHLHADGGLALVGDARVDPQLSGVDLGAHGQHLLQVDGGRNRGHLARRAVHADLKAQFDCDGDRIAIRNHVRVHDGLGQVGDHTGQRIGARAVLLVQEHLGLLAGHGGHQHLRLQLLVVHHLVGDGLLDPADLLLGQLLLQIHALGGVDVQLRDVILEIGIAEGDLASAVVQLLHGDDLRIQHIARQIALLPFGDVGLVPVDLAVVEHDDLIRLQLNFAAQDQRAGDDVALDFGVAQQVGDLRHLGLRLGIGARVFLGLGHGGVIGHVVPQHVGQALGELDDLDLLAEHADRQRVDIFRLIGEQDAVLRRQREGAAGHEARLAVELCAVRRLAHGDLGGLVAGAGLHAEAAGGLLRGHALGQDDRDGRRRVGQLHLGHVAGLLDHLLLIGDETGVERHALFDGIGIAKARGAFRIHAPAAERIALLGGVQAIHRLGQKVLALGKRQRRQRATVEGLEGHDGRVGLVHEPGVQRHLAIHAAEQGHGRGVFRVLIPRGEHLSLQRSGGRAVIHRAARGDLLGLHRRALGDEGHQPLGQDEVHLLAGLQLHHLGVGAGHREGGLGLVDHGGAGAHGQGAHALLHAHEAQRAAALDEHRFGALDDDLGQLRRRIHVQIDAVGRGLLVLRLILHHGVLDVHALDLTSGQIDAAGRVQGQGLRLDRRQGQVLHLRERQARRRQAVHRQAVADEGDVARIGLALHFVDGRLRIDYGRECRLHQPDVFISGDGRGGFDLRKLLRQVALVRQDGQVYAVIRQTQVGYARRKRGQIDICRVLHDEAQHTGNLPGRLGPCDLRLQRIHAPGGRTAGRARLADRLRQSGKAAGGEDGYHQDHG